MNPANSNSEERSSVLPNCQPLVALPVIILSSPSRPGIGTTVPEQKKTWKLPLCPKEVHESERTTPCPPPVSSTQPIIPSLSNNKSCQPKNHLAHHKQTPKTSTRRPILHGHLRILAGPAKSFNYKSLQNQPAEIYEWRKYLPRDPSKRSWSKLEAEQCQICLCPPLHSIARLSLRATSIRTIQHSLWGPNFPWFPFTNFSLTLHPAYCILFSFMMSNSLMWSHLKMDCTSIANWFLENRATQNFCLWDDWQLVVVEKCFLATAWMFATGDGGQLLVIKHAKTCYCC